VSVELPAGRHLWVQVLRGGVEAAATKGASLEAGDGLAASDERRFELAAGNYGAELLVFDLA